MEKKKKRAKIAGISKDWAIITLILIIKWNEKKKTIKRNFTRISLDSIEWTLTWSEFLVIIGKRMKCEKLWNVFGILTHKNNGHPAI